MKLTEEGTDLRAPDRWRLITIPDAAMVGWKEGARAE
jgi:hypothetical protein